MPDQCELCEVPYFVPCDDPAIIDKICFGFPDDHSGNTPGYIFIKNSGENPFL